MNKGAKAPRFYFLRRRGAWRGQRLHDLDEQLTSKLEGIVFQASAQTFKNKERQERKEMAYGRKWKPSKKKAMEWRDKKEALEADTSITISESSAYFKVRDVNYRVSGHSPYAAANHIQKNNATNARNMTEDQLEQRRLQVADTIKSAQIRGAGEVQIQAAQTKAKEIKEAIENGTFNFGSARYYNRKEALAILQEKGIYTPKKPATAFEKRLQQANERRASQKGQPSEQLTQNQHRSV